MWEIIDFNARSISRRLPKHGKATFSVGATHLCNVAAKRRDIARVLFESLRDFMCEEETDLFGSAYNWCADRLADGGMSPSRQREQLLLLPHGP